MTEVSTHVTNELQNNNDVTVSERAFMSELKNTRAAYDRLNNYTIMSRNPDPIKYYVASIEGILSSTATHSSDVISKMVTNTETQALVDYLHAVVTQSRKFIHDDAEYNKMILNAAKTEAELKGFSVPSDLFTQSKAFVEALQEALRTTSGQSIPKAQYVQAVKDKCIDILKQDPKNTAEKLETYEAVIIKGAKNQKFDKESNQFIPKENGLSQAQFKELQEAATSLTQQISNRLEQHYELGKQLERSVIAQQLFDTAIQEVETNDQDRTITTRQKEKIYKRVLSEARSLDQEQFFKEPHQAVHAMVDQIITKHQGLQDIDRNRIEIIRQFNIKPKAGIDLLQQICKEHGLNASQELADLFVEEKKQLNLDYVGNYLSNFGNVKSKDGQVIQYGTENKETLEHFLATMNFHGKPFTAAMREYLQGFKLPVEAEKIDILVEAFGKKYFADSTRQTTAIANSDVAYLLAYQTIMLNTSLHNPNVSEQDRMTLEQLKVNLHNLNGNTSFPSNTLEEIYNDIQTKPFEFHFIETPLGYTLKSNNLNNDSAFREINSILGGNKAAGNLLKDPMEVKSDKPKTWLSHILGYKGSVIVQDKDDAKVTIQVYEPNIMSRWFLGKKAKVIIQPGHGDNQLYENNIKLAAQLAAGFKTVNITEQDIGAGYDYLKKDLYKAYDIAKGQAATKTSDIVLQAADREELSSRTSVSNAQDIKKSDYRYTEDDIKNILEVNLDKEHYSIINHIDLTKPEMVKDTLNMAIYSDLIVDNKPVLIPINDGHEHWVSMMISRDSKTNDIVFTYNDPAGKVLDEHPELVQLITEAYPDATIIDLKTKQQERGCDDGVFVCDNLIKLARGQALRSTTESHGYESNLRASHAAALVKDAVRSQALKIGKPLKSNAQTRHNANMQYSNPQHHNKNEISR